MSIRLSEVPLAQLVHGLSADLFDAGLAMINDVDAGILAAPLWEDPLVVALPARHPLLVFKEVPLEEVVSYPLVLCDPQVCDGCSRQRELLFRSVEARPIVAEYVTTHGLMLALVAAGCGIGFRARTPCGLPACRCGGQTAGRSVASLTTYLLRPEGEKCGTH